MDAKGKAKPFLPGSVGAIDDPRLPITVNQVRPYIVAILLHHGMLKLEDAIASISPQCNVSDLRIGAYEFGSDLTHLESMISEALTSMQECGIVSYDAEQKTWQLRYQESSKSLSVILNWVSSMGAQLPASLKL